MKLLISYFTLALTTLLPAQQVDENLIESLLSTRDENAFSEVLKKAELAQLPKQTLLEARFLYFVDQQDTQALAKLSHELIAARDEFSPKLSSIFSLKEDWLAIIEFTQALDHLQQGNEALFKKHITEAFWLSPHQAGAYAPYIDKLRLKHAMSQVQVSPKLELHSLLTKKLQPVLSQESPVTLLYFWSPWSREFTETIDDFKATCLAAKQSNIPVLSVLAEQSKEVELDAKSLISETQIDTSAEWLIDTQHMDLSTLLRIQNIPTVVLLSKQGKVLFNGHPTNPLLWSTLEKTVDGFKRPTHKK